MLRYLTLHQYVPVWRCSRPWLLPAQMFRVPALRTAGDRKFTACP